MPIPAQHGYVPLCLPFGQNLRIGIKPHVRRDGRKLALGGAYRIRQECGIHKAPIAPHVGAHAVWKRIGGERRPPPILARQRHRGLFGRTCAKRNA